MQHKLRNPQILPDRGGSQNLFKSRKARGLTRQNRGKGASIHHDRQGEGGLNSL